MQSLHSTRSAWGAIHAPANIILLTVFVFLAGGSFASAQDLPAAQPEVTLGSQSQAGTSEQSIYGAIDGALGQPTDPTPDPAPDPGTYQAIEKKDLCADTADSCDAQNQPADTQTTQNSNLLRSSRHGKDGVVHEFVGDFFHDEYRIWTGPFRAQSYDSHVMKKYGVPFLLISGALIGTDTRTQHWFANSNNQLIWSGRVSQIGAPYTLAGFTAATYLLGRFTGNNHLRETGFLALEALAESQFITLILKEATQRERPIAGMQHIGFGEGGTSFPSGHASGSFAVAAVFAYEYRDHIAIPIAAYALASIVDVSRLSARQHWLSDIFVGSAVGFLSGRYVYKQHHDPTLPGGATSRLIPQLASRENGLGLYWDF